MIFKENAYGNILDFRFLDSGHSTGKYNAKSEKPLVPSILKKGYSTCMSYFRKATSRLSQIREGIDTMTEGSHLAEDDSGLVQHNPCLSELYTPTPWTHSVDQNKELASDTLSKNGTKDSSFGSYGSPTLR